MIKIVSFLFPFSAIFTINVADNDNILNTIFEYETGKVGGNF